MIQEKQLRNLDDLKREIATAWQNLSQSYCSTQARSMVQSLSACYKAKGGAAKY